MSRNSNTNNMEKTVSVRTTPITYKHTLNSPAKSISTNKDGTQCVVGGRNLCSVFHVEDDRFTER